MSRASDSTFGLQRGKIGDRIGVVINGKQFYKGLYAPTNPRTPAQQRHRAKLAFANRLSAVLADAVNVGFVKVADRERLQTPRNAFVKTNWNNGALVWDDEREEWTVCYELLLLADGPLYIDPSMTASVDGDDLLIVSPTSCVSNGEADDDVLRVALYCPESGQVCLYDGARRRDSAESRYILPAEFRGRRVVAYAWFQSLVYHRATPGHAAVPVDMASPSRCLGVFDLG